MLANLPVPLFGYSCFGFLLVGVVLAVAVWIAFKSGEKGTTKLNGWAGCFVGLGLLGIAGMMALGCAGIMLLTAKNEVVKRGPVKSFEFRFDDEDDRADGARQPSEDREADDRKRLELVVRLRDSAYVGTIIDWLREHVEEDLAFSDETVTVDGEEYTDLSVQFECEKGEYDELRRELEDEFPGLRLPDGGRIELREPDF